MHELAPDPPIQPGAARHVMHIRADLLAQSAISLMNVTFIARNELAAYLVSSAVSSAVNRIGASIRYSSRYNRRSTVRARSLFPP